ncbi:hypothetical protein [uncultured Xanthomonas sp.]|uniref:hypothetical protein n=1 Tax=uncultured Xanthomonas sp. TaxID=152831 RepID=UPI0025CFD495|nr:hypothetical protein [uncultured Xanthomonas sp.]
MVQDQERWISGAILLFVFVGFLLTVVLARLTNRRERALEALPAVPMARVSVGMHWDSDTSMPIPKWEAIAEAEPAEAGADALHVYWTSAARQWLEVLDQQLGDHYAVTESADFLLLSNLEARPATVVLQTCQRMLARIRRSLGALAVEQGMGKHVVIVFADDDDYYAYVSNYYPEGGEYAMSSGMFIRAGYGHFVVPLAIMDAMEPVIAHELTHCLLQHLPIPAWLNEGLAVNTEHTMFPQLAMPSAQKYFQHEIPARHAAYWNADSIQTFWSGKSFLATDDGNALSYDLAKKITALAAGDEPAFRAFVAEASMDDGGVAAAQHLGYPLEHLVQAVLGEGDWSPKPERWHRDVERGQF